ncbi:hypothetical protein G6F42_018773 [Rhizopus arrhizus]|nr:hypothetical protein G6F42_018773 [Rhizopus arrhizus]
MRFPPYQELLTTIFNNALDKGVFPDSWNQSIMTLLPKKGDPSDKKNYRRPLSLANCDCKYFTRILNRRMIEVSKKLISSNQIGFVSGQYIAEENGLRSQHIMEDAQRQYDIADERTGTTPLHKDIGLLLDQEKAYDRVILTFFIQAAGFKSLCMASQRPLSTAFTTTSWRSIRSNQHQWLFY